MRTNFQKESDGFLDSRTDSAQIASESVALKMKFPKVIRHRKAEVTIYGRKPNYLFYRISYRVAGKRILRNYSKYSDALKEAEKKVREIAEGSQAIALNADQSRDALNAFEMLEAFRKSIGRRITMSAAISEFVEVSKKLGERTLREAVDGFVKTVATVTRKDILEAVNEFSQAAEALTKADEGQRSQLSTKYAYNRQRQLGKFAAAFPGTAICDLTKGHLDKFIESLGKLKTESRNHRKAVSAKSRNHYRAAIRQFLLWAVRKDYLPPTHRLLEADGLRPEYANNSETSFYSPIEFQTLLAVNEDKLLALRPIIAIGGLAGLRTSELLRLNWEDIWRIQGHVEITAGKSKTRQRRLVEICPALAEWLKPYDNKTSGKLWEGHEVSFQQDFVELCNKAKVQGKSIKRKHNGLRHAFCTYHFALHANENLTAQQAGNSPAMIHKHYKGLATKTEAEKWFAVMPSKITESVKLSIPSPVITNPTHKTE